MAAERTSVEVRRRALLAAGAALALVAPACSAGELDDTAGSPRTAELVVDRGPTSELLYALQGTGTATATTLTVMIEDGGTVTWVTDRPDRSAGSFSPAMFAGTAWRASGFDDDPPNAILLARTGATPVELTSVAWDEPARTLTFGWRALGDARPAPGDLGEVQLFIDDAAACTVGDDVAYFEDPPPPITPAQCQALVGAASAAFRSQGSSFTFELGAATYSCEASRGFGTTCTGPGGGQLFLAGDDLPG